MGSAFAVRHRRSTNMQQPVHDIPVICPSVWYKRSCCSAERFNDAVASRVSPAPNARAAMSLGENGIERLTIPFLGILWKIGPIL